MDPVLSESILNTTISLLPPFPPFSFLSISFDLQGKQYQLVFGHFPSPFVRAALINLASLFLSPASVVEPSKLSCLVLLRVVGMTLL